MSDEITAEEMNAAHPIARQCILDAHKGSPFDVSTARMVAIIANAIVATSRQVRCEERLVLVAICEDVGEEEDARTAARIADKVRARGDK